MEPTLYRTFLYFFMHGPFALLVANLSPGRFKFSHTNVAYRSVKYRTLLCESPSSVFSFLHVNHFCHGISILDLVQKWPKKNSALFLPPATKLGQSYVFTRVCDSVHRGRGCYPSMHCRWYPIMPCSRSPGVCVLSQHALQVVSQHALQQVSRGWAPARGGGSAPGGLLLGGCLVETPPGRLLLRAVRILLECILIIKKFQSYQSGPNSAYIFSTIRFFLNSFTK